MRKLNTNSSTLEYGKPQVLSASKSRYFEKVKRLRQLGVYEDFKNYLRENDINPFTAIENSVTYLLTVGELKELEKKGITGRKYGVHVINGTPLHKMPGYWDACDSWMYPEEETARLEDKIAPPKVADVRTVARKTEQIHKNRFRLVKTGD
ncbi:hypothetical protein KY336_02110 [Candidatus Woesearchaeota archaeon]|nr:hypothetical protein [Candidatus Woesearchaeota archaeon]